MDDERLYHENLSVIGERFPHLRGFLGRANRSGLICVPVTSASGHPSLELRQGKRKILLHSKKDPKIEARRFAESSTGGNERFIVLIGFGMGYFVEALLERNPDAFILVIEPDIVILQEAMRLRDLTSTLRSENLLMLPGNSIVPDDVAGNAAAEDGKPEDALIEDDAADDTATDDAGACGRVSLDDVIGVNSPAVLAMRPYLELFREKTARIRNEISAYLNRTEINVATLRRFDRLWTRNSFRNASAFFRLPGIERLRDVLGGSPAVVVCAGPSLDADAGTLRSLADRLAIIAVDTALKPLMKRGIVPDFVVTVDPQFINCFFTAQLEPFPGKPPALIADPGVHPATLKGYPGLVFITSSVFSPGKFIERFSGGKGSVAAGGSVAVAAFDAARILGADPIVMLGLDLSYGSGTTHASGSFIEEYVLTRTGRFQRPANYYVDYLRKGDPTYAAARDGTRVITDRRLLLYKKWFENRPHLAGTRVVNAASGGLHIEGFQDVPLDRLFDLTGTADGGTRPDGAPDEKKLDKEALRKRLEEIWFSERLDCDRLTAFISHLTSLKASILELRSFCREGRLLSTRLIDSPSEVEELNRSLTEIDGEILSHGEENQLLSMVMQTPISDVLRGGTGDGLSARERSRRLYTDMEEGLEFLMRLFELSIKDLMKLRIHDDNEDKVSNLL
jgi:hypothetical protein